MVFADWFAWNSLAVIGYTVFGLLAWVMVKYNPDLNVKVRHPELLGFAAVCTGWFDVKMFFLVSVLRLVS